MVGSKEWGEREAPQVNTFSCKAHLLNLLKPSRVTPPAETDRSNTWSSGGHFTFNPQQRAPPPSPFPLSLSYKTLTRRSNVFDWMTFRIKKVLYKNPKSQPVVTRQSLPCTSKQVVEELVFVVFLNSLLLFEPTIHKNRWPSAKKGRNSISLRHLEHRKGPA